MNFRQTKLKNGIRVITVPHADTMAVTVLALHEVGSRYEDVRNNGVSHFIEHMMFKGTERRPNTLDISRDLDSVGADYNAFTTKDHTGYYVRLQSGRFALAVDMLEDMICHSKFDSKDIESERQVILEEVRMYEDNPLMQIDELAEEELFRGSPLCMRIGGTVKSVSGLTRDELISFRDSYYAPERIVLAVAGKFDEVEALDELERVFGRMTKGGGRAPKPYVKFAGATYRTPRVCVSNKETEQVQVAMAFPAFSYTDRRTPVAHVLATILGGTMSSRLFTSVREREGLCYFIRASVGPYQDVGHLTVQAGLAKDRLDRALHIIMKELKQIRSKPVTDEELTRAKEYIRGKTLLSLEDSSRQADWFARQELLTGRVVTPEDELARIAAVTREQVQKAAADIFRRNRLSLAVIGPFKDAARFNAAARKL